MDDLLFGLRTTVLGMTFVFAILAIVWGLLNVLMKLDARLERQAAGVAPAPAGGEPAALPETTVRLVGVPSDLDSQVVAAVTIAVLRHAEARRLQAAPAMRSYWPGSLLFASRWVSAGRTRQGQSWRRRR
jgi:Na+-transporting methylmalonyl-CoA/oxaloacetate decarboxylase gamma subunit